MTDWLNYVDPKRRSNFVEILAELSNLQEKDDLNFIIIGAVPLLINGYLKYVVFWDIDLLFKDITNLRAFIAKSKPNALKVVNYDEDLMTNENITSFHTAWSFAKTWCNVDYIIREGIFNFYTEGITANPPYNAAIEHFKISLYFARPWDIMVEKILSPRTEKDINLKIDLSIDIRQIFVIYKHEKDNPQFWKYVTKKASKIKRENEFKEKFFYLLVNSVEYGYTNIEISPSALRTLKSTQ